MGNDHPTGQAARHDACFLVVMPYQTTATQRCAYGMQTSSASPVRTRIFRSTSQEEIEHLQSRGLSRGLQLIYHWQTKTPRQKNYLSSSPRGTLKEAI